MSSTTTSADASDTAVAAARPAERPQRADARRNRRRVLEAAKECFAEVGVDAQIDDVARRAGVGVGTVYRHFPTKEALVQAIAADKFEEVAAMTAEALAKPDAWAAFREMTWSVARAKATDRALAELISEHPQVFAGCAAQRPEVMAQMHELVGRAQASGDMRPDLAAEDVPMIMCGIAGVVAHERHVPGAMWERYVSLLLDGLRARPGADPLPPRDA